MSGAFPSVLPLRLVEPAASEDDAPLSLDVLERARSREFSMLPFLNAERDACITTILARVKRAQADGGGFSMGDLTMLIRDAFSCGAAAMSEAMLHRENARTHAMLTELQHQEALSARRDGFPEGVLPMPWPMPSPVENPFNPDQTEG